MFVGNTKQTTMDLQYVKKLYDAALAKQGVTLDLGYQVNKFEQICIKTINDNPELDFQGHLVVANKYLELMIKFPDSEI